MFIGQEKDWDLDKKCLPPALVSAFEEMRQQNPRAMKPGKYPLTSVKDAFFLVQDIRTKPTDKNRPEAHRLHIDIQYIVEGVERFGFAPRCEGVTPIEDKFDAMDIAFYAPRQDEFFFDLKAGQFVVFCPGEFHRPQCDVRPEMTNIAVYKVVVKVPMSALA